MDRIPKLTTIDGKELDRIIKENGGPIKVKEPKFEISFEPTIIIDNDNKKHTIQEFIQ